MTMPSSWADLTLYHYLGLGGGGLIVLALLLWLTPLSRLRIPSIFLGVVGGLAAGLALGIMGMGLLGYQVEPQGKASGESPPDPMMAKAPGGKGKASGKGKAGDGGRQRQSVKPQLENIISKLDLLMYKPLALTLDAEQKKKMCEILGKLDEEEALTEEDATAKIESLKRGFHRGAAQDA